MTGAVFLVSLLVVPLVLLLSPGLVSSASTFTVDSTAGTVDANLGDGIAADASGNTTLRVAIMEAKPFQLGTRAAASGRFNLMVARSRT